MGGRTGATLVRGSSAASRERDDVRLDPPDQVTREREDRAEGEPVAVAALERGLADAERDDGPTLLDQSADGQRRAALEGVVLDLAVERLLVPSRPPTLT